MGEKAVSPRPPGTNCFRTWAHHLTTRCLSFPTCKKPGSPPRAGVRSCEVTQAKHLGWGLGVARAQGAEAASGVDGRLLLGLKPLPLCALLASHSPQTLRPTQAHSLESRWLRALVPTGSIRFLRGTTQG